MQERTGSTRYRRTALGRAAQLVAAVAIVAAVGALVYLEGSMLSHGLRERLQLVTPLRALGFAFVVVALSLLWSFIDTDAGRPAAVTRLRELVLSCAASVARVPAFVGLTAIVAVTAGFRVLLGRFATEPRVLGDELVYTDLAKSLALHGKPLLRGEFEIGHSILYPLVLSPVYRFASDGATGYVAAKTTGAVLVALTAVPAYLLARRVVTHGWSIGIAALVAAEPWTAYASLTMTESLFLPLFTTFALALTLMLERPTARRQLLVLIALAVLIGARPQALVLGGSVAAAVALNGLLAGSLRRALGTYAIVVCGLSIALLAGLIATAAGVPIPGSSARGLLTEDYGPLQLVKWALWNLAILELALGFIALAAFPLALSGLIRRTSSDKERSLGIAALTLSLGVLLSVAALSASPYGLDILHERNLFYVTPLVLVCLAHWLTHGMRRPAALLTAVVVAVVALPLMLPEAVVLRSNNVDSPTAAWLHALHDQLASVPLRVMTVGLALVAAAALLRIRRAVVPLLSTAVAFVAIGAALDYSGPFSESQDRELAWVDHALPSGATATLVHLGLTRPDQPCADATDSEQQALIVWTEFFNTRIDRVAHIFETIGRDNLESPQLTVEDGGLVSRDGRPFGPAYVVIDSRQPVVGRRLAQLDLGSLGTQFQEGSSLSLWSVDPPLRFLAHAQPLPPRPNGGEC